MPDPSSLISKTDNSMAAASFKSIGNLIKLLPTGTVFLFQFVSPILTNAGECSRASKISTSVLIGLCFFSCALSCFTDSYKDSKSKRHYGIATRKGLWTSSDEDLATDLSRYRVKIGDFTHAFLNVVVFAMVALLDMNVVNCFYPSFKKSEKSVLTVMPPVIGFLSSVAFALFPSVRSGIGYPPSGDDSSEEKH